LFVCVECKYENYLIHVQNDIPFLSLFHEDKFA
jgi:hypothetical protein